MEANAFLEALYNANYERLYIYAENLLFNAAYAEEAVQETFFEAVRKQDALMRHAKPEAWLMETLKNKIRVGSRRRALEALYFISLEQDLAQESKKLAVEDRPFGSINELLDAIRALLPPEDYRLLCRITLEGATHLDGPPLDEATVDSILTVLAERRRTPADTSAAWQDFSAYYSTPDSPGAPVRRTRAHLQKAYTRLRIPIRVVSAAAAMFILIFALFPRVETGASDAPNAYITWTDEYLKIDALPHAGWSLPQGGEYHTDNAGLQQLHDALAAYGVTGVVPSWVPEGAVLAEYDFGGEFAGTTSFYAYFSLPDGTGFSMDFTIFAEPSAMEGSWIVKDERPVSYFTLGDVGYYQYTNNASTGICWLNGRVSGLVSGKVPAEVIRSIVYSIH